MGKLPKKSPAWSTGTLKTCFICCGIWRATIPRSRSRPARKRWTTGFHSQRNHNPSLMPAQSAQSRSHSLSVPWDDVFRFVRQLTHDLRNSLNLLKLQSASIAELTKDQNLQT